MTSFKVKLPAEYAGEQVQEFSFAADATVRQAVDSVARETHLSSPDLYTFCVPVDGKPEGTWMDPSKPLSDYSVGSAVVQVRRAYCLVNTICFKGEFWSKQILYSLCAPLASEWMPYVHYKFGLDKDEAMTLAFVDGVKPGAELDLSVALKDQAIPAHLADCKFLLYETGTTVDKTGLNIFLDVQKKQQQRGTKQQAASDVAAPLTGESEHETPASTLLMNFPVLSGYLSTLNKKKKWERWFSILINDHLYYYRSQNDAKPAQVIHLAGYSAATVDDKKKKIQYGIELTCTAKKESVMNKADESRWQKLWYDAIVKVSEEARINLEKKEKELAEKKTSGKVFEAPLADQVEVQDGSQLPVVVEKCMEYIEDRALDQEGIFRLSGSAVLIKEYKDRFDSGENVSFENESDPHAVAGLLKLYFRELPEPIMKWDQFDNFLIGEAIPNPTLRLRYLRHLLEKNLPALNRALLRRLVAFLRKVNERSEVNKMPIHNIATVFGPNLLRKRDANMLQMVEDTSQINNIVNIFINFDGYLFNDRPLPEESEEDQMLGAFAKATYDYAGDTEEDLNFKANELIAVIAQGVDGWWKGEIDGKFGKFPGSYVQLLSAEAYQKNMRRVRFEKEMVKLRQQLADEEKTIEKLQGELAELEPTADEVRASYEEMEAVILEAASVLKKGGNFSAFLAKNKELNDMFASYGTFHDSIADSRHEILAAVQTMNAATAPSKDKKKKADKKQEKVNEAARKAVAGLDLRFGQEEHLHGSILEYEGAVIQGLQTMELLGLFLQDK